MNLATLYTRCPQGIKRLLADIEAINRDRKRKSGEYKKLSKNVNFEQVMGKDGLDEQLQLIEKQVENAVQNIPAYKGKPYSKLDDFPIVSKQEIREHYKDYLHDGTNKKECHHASTSGSTGTPFQFYLHQEAVMRSRLYAEKYIEYLGGRARDIPTVRISGIRIVPPGQEKPPFWVYIDVYRQLQCSAYHISLNTAQYYIDAMKKYKVQNGTGYPSAWYSLAQFTKENGIDAPRLSFIVMDSEKIEENERETIEEVFHCKVYMTYGLSEMAQAAVECPYHHYHIVPPLVYAETARFENGEYEEDEGEIILTTLSTKYTPLIRYRTGDMGILRKGGCPCGWKSPYFEKITGRVEDYILYKGKKFRRLGFIMSSAKNVLKSQIIQSGPEDLEIHIIPDKGFSKEDMTEPLRIIRDRIGNINVKWMVVPELEKTKSGKIKYIIRRSF